MLNSKFGDSSGNLYKPEAQWKVDEEVNDSTYPKKTNEDIANFDDINEALSALHGSRDNSSDWRTNLELSFNVNIFLKWLAVNTVIQDWDTYGNMAHNYYLYANPTNSGKLTWIPWDHNMSLSNSLGMKDCLPLDMKSVTNEWPLIRYIMDDGLYNAQYWDFVEQFNETVFTVSEIQNRVQSEYNLIAPFVIGSYKENPGYTFVESTAAFEEARDELLQFIETRHNTVKDSY